MIHPYDPQAAMNAKYAAFARKDADTARRLQSDPAGRSELVSLAARLLHLRTFLDDDPHDEELRRVAARLRKLANGAAPRASQAAGEPHSTGCGSRTAHDPGGGSAGRTEPRQCDGSDDPRKRCGHHHATGLSNGFGGYECCCGDTWRGAPDECLSGAKTGQPVALRDRVYALIGYLTDECDPANLDACADAVIPAIRAAIADEIEAEEAKIDRRSSDQASWHSNGMIAAANLIRGAGQ